MNLYWREPLWLLLALFPLVSGVWLWLHQRQRWQRVADSHLLPWVKADLATTSLIRRFVLATGWLLICVALAGPRSPQWVPPEHQTSNTLFALLDLSDSMRTRDGQPDRIGSSRELLMAWLTQLPSNTKVGLVVFAGQAHLYLPPTPDLDLVAHFLKQPDQLHPPLLGNALDEAVSEALSVTEDIDHTDLVIFSDGDMDNATRSRVKARLKPLAHWLWVGVGSDEASQVLNAQQQPLSIDGRRITSRRDTAWVEQLAAQSSGRYYRIEHLAGQTAKQTLQWPTRQIEGANQQDVLWHEWFGFALLPGILLLMCGLHTPKTSLRTILLGALTLGLIACQSDAPSAEQQLAKGDFTSAREAAETETGYRARFIEGTACYRLKDYPCAAEAFARAAWQSNDRTQRGAAVFNLGNAYFRLGDYAQAEVLFRDAGLLGVAPDRVSLNLAYAHDLKLAMRQRMADIAESERRALWRANALIPPDGFDERLAEGENLVRELSGQSPLRRIAPEQLQALLNKGLERLQQSAGNRAENLGRSWVRSPQALSPQNTAQLFNRVMAIESGLGAQPDKPKLPEGQRAW